MSNKPANYEVLIKQLLDNFDLIEQYLRSILDISGSFETKPESS